MRGAPASPRRSWGRAVIILGATLAACFPAYAVSTAGDGGADGSSGEGGTNDAPAAEGSSQTDGSAQDAGDAGPLPMLPSCGDMSGLQANAPWPMHGYCPGQRRSSPLPGPGPGAAPTIKWHQALQVDPGYTPLVMADGTVLAVSTKTNTITALGPDGGAGWSWTAPSGDGIAWPPAVGADGTVYVPCVNHVYGVADDGGTAWTSSDSIGTRSPAVVGPGPTIYVDDTTGELWAINGTGVAVWGQPAQFSSAVDNMTPMFGVAGTSTLYQTTTTGELWAITPSGVATKIGPGVAPSSTYRVIAAPDGNLRITSDEHAFLWSVSPDGGQIVWTWASNDAGTDMARLPAVSDDSVVYMGLQSGPVVAIAPDGTRKWTTGDQALCNAITLDSAGVLYTGCDDGLHAYEPDGGLLWKVTTFDGGLDYGISIGAGGVLYVAAGDGTIYAVSR